MTEPIAEPSDVRDRLNLRTLSDSEIQTRVEDATFEIGQVTSLERMDDDLRMQLEWRLAGLMILSERKGSRSTSQKSIGNASKTYDASTVEELADWIERRGPAGLVKEDEFWHESIQG